MDKSGLQCKSFRKLAGPTTTYSCGMQHGYWKRVVKPPLFLLGMMTVIGLSYTILSLYCFAFKSWAMNSCIPILQVKNNCAQGNLSF